MYVGVAAALLFALPVRAQEPAPAPADAARAQVRIVEQLVDAGLAEQALSAAAEMRAAGAVPEGLDVAQARAMHARGLSTDALALLDAHLRDHRKDATAWAVRGVILLDTSAPARDAGRVSEAVEALGRARRHAPRDATILNNLGWALLVAGKPVEAEEALRAALVQDPSSRRARNNLGIALARAGHDEEALATFRAAGSEADARVNLAAVCEWRGDVPGALTHLRAALAATPDHPAASAALVRLASP